MKTKILAFILVVIPIYSFGQEISVDSLLQKSDSIRHLCSQLKDKDKGKGYEQALILQDSVYNLMADSVRYFSAFEKDARAYRFFACTDSSVFSHNYIKIDTRKLPKYMQAHYAAVSTIRQFAECIINMENKVDAAKADKDVTDADRKNFVAIKIKSGIDKANELLNQIDKINMSSFSEEQNKFYHGLSERLTDILKKYIF